MFDDIRTGRAVTHHKVQHTFRQSCFDKNFRQQQSRMRGIFSRFENECVAGDKPRKEIPGRYRHRKIPWSNESADADRYTKREIELIGQFAWCIDTKEPPPLGRTIVCSIDPLLNVTERFGDRFPHFTGHHGSKFIFPGSKDVTGTANDIASMRCGNMSPCVECFRCCTNSRSNIVCS